MSEETRISIPDTSHNATVEEPANKEEPILGKFKSVDDLAKAYVELERKQSQAKPQAPPQQQNATQADTSKPNPLNSIPDQQQQAGQLPKNFEKYSKEFTQNGRLSDDSYKELTDQHGIPREYIDQYVVGLMASQQVARQAVLNNVGGETEYAKMIQWASTSLTPEQKQAYNAAVNGADPEQARLAVEGLSAMYRQNYGDEPKLIGGRATSSGEGFDSWQQLEAAMEDTRYSKDPAYRASIERKLAQSKNLSLRNN